MFHRTITILLITGALGCASQGFIRSEYSLETFDDLITSNSPTFDRKHKFEHSKDHVKFHYEFLAENHSKSKIYVLDLKGASFTTNASPQGTTCTSQATNDTLTLSPGSRTKVACDIEALADNQNKLAMKDTVGTLRIPVTTPKKGVLEFGYKLRVEDFE